MNIIYLLEQVPLKVAGECILHQFSILQTFSHPLYAREQFEICMKNFTFMQMTLSNVHLHQYRVSRDRQKALMHSCMTDICFVSGWVHLKLRLLRHNIEIPPSVVLRKGKKKKAQQKSPSHSRLFRTILFNHGWWTRKWCEEHFLTVMPW